MAIAIRRIKVTALLLALICMPISVSASATRSEFEKLLWLTASDDKKAALKTAENYLRTHPKDLVALSIYARMLVDSDRLTEAKVVAERALAINPGETSALIARAYCRAQAKDYKGAIADYEKASNPEPVYFAPITQTSYQNLTALYRLTNRSNADAAHKAKLEALVRKARDIRENGAIDQCLKLLNAVLTEQPKYYYARLLRGVCLSNKSEYKSAIKDFDYLIEAFPRNAWFYYLRSDAYNELGDKASSANDLLTIILLKPRVVALNYTAQTGRVREHFEGKDETIVNLADIYYLLGSRYDEMGKRAQALSAYDNCIALDAREIQVRYERALLNHKAGRNQLALSDLNRAIADKPTYLDAYLERARLKESMHDPGAINDYDYLVKQGPNEYGSFVMRAEYKRRAGKFEDAVIDFKKAIAISPSEADAYMGMAQSYESLKQNSLALANYRKALQLSPEDKGLLKSNIARLSASQGK